MNRSQSAAAGLPTSGAFLFRRCDAELHTPVLRSSISCRTCAWKCRLSCPYRLGCRMNGRSPTGSVLSVIGPARDEARTGPAATW